MNSGEWEDLSFPEVNIPDDSSAKRRHKPTNKLTARADKCPEWSLPTPLSGEFSPPEYPVNAFPVWLGEMVKAVARVTQTPPELAVARVTQTPPELAGCMALSVLATCAAAKFVVEVQEAWIEPLNIFTTTAMESGNRKSAVVEFLTRLILTWETNEHHRLQPEITKKRNERDILEAQLKEKNRFAANADEEDEHLADVLYEIDAIAKKLDSEPLPVFPRLNTDDCTPECLLDLHALRHTFGTMLIASGADIKTVQSLMRHSTPSLTLAIYIHKDEKRMAQAVANLPDLGPTSKQASDMTVKNSRLVTFPYHPPPCSFEKYDISLRCGGQRIPTRRLVIHGANCETDGYHAGTAAGTVPQLLDAAGASQSQRRTGCEARRFGRGSADAAEGAPGARAVPRRVGAGVGGVAAADLAAHTGGCGARPASRQARRGIGTLAAGVARSIFGAVGASAGGRAALAQRCGRAWRAAGAFGGCAGEIAGAAARGAAVEALRRVNAGRNREAAGALGGRSRVAAAPRREGAARGMRGNGVES